MSLSRLIHALRVQVFSLINLWNKSLVDGNFLGMLLKLMALVFSILNARPILWNLSAIPLNYLPSKSLPIKMDLSKQTIKNHCQIEIVGGIVHQLYLVMIL